MDIGKSFTFVFEDEDWIVKILIAAAIFTVGLLFSWLILIPLILAGALLGGYAVEITRRVIQGHPKPLPEWDNWGDLMADGFKFLAVGVVYALPFIIIIACLGIPVGILGDQGGEGAAVLSAILSIGLSCFSLIWGIAISLLLPAAIAFWVAEDDLGAAFRFGEVFAFVRNHFVTYLITFLMSWVASIVGSLGSVVCGIGVLVTAPYGWMVTGHLYGQAYLDAKGQLAVPAHEDLFEEPVEDVGEIE